MIRATSKKSLIFFKNLLTLKTEQMSLCPVFVLLTRKVIEI